MSDTLTYTTLLVVTVPDTSPEGLKIVNTSHYFNRPDTLILLLYSLPIFYSNKWSL